MSDKHTRSEQHLSLNERLVFEEGSAGRRGFDIPKLDVPERDLDSLIGRDMLRDDIDGMPELSELDVIRQMVDSGVLVIAGGGGGIPVWCNAEGELCGAGAVIDKERIRLIVNRYDKKAQLALPDI